MTLQYNKINVVINNTPLLAESVNINENSPQKAIRTFNNNVVFDNVPTTLTNTIEIKYYLEPNNEVNFQNLMTEINDTTIPIPISINIGNVTVLGYLTNYSLTLSQNQIVFAESTYKIFNSFNGNFGLQSSGDSLFYDVNQQSGIAHYWSASFYSGITPIQNNNILELGYRAEINLEPIYSVGNSYPVQVIINSITEKLDILTEQQYNVNYSGQIIDNLFIGLQTLNLANISSIWDSSINNNIQLKLTDFVLQETKSDITTNNLILFSNTFSRGH